MREGLIMLKSIKVLCFAILLLIMLNGTAISECIVPSIPKKVNYLEFDYDRSGNVIEPGSTIDIYVIGCNPPYTWSITSGHGYSISNVTTQSDSNQLTCINGT
jgi:hypothetical protein